MASLVVCKKKKEKLKKKGHSHSAQMMHQCKIFILNQLSRETLIWFSASE